MARTKKGRPSQSISNVLSQRRQARNDNQQEGDSESEGDSVIEEDLPPNPRQSTSGTFKRPLPPVKSPGRAFESIPTSNLDLSVKKYPQEKLPMVRESPEAKRERNQDACIYFITEADDTWSHYMNFAWGIANISKHIDRSALFKLRATELMNKLENKQQVIGNYVIEFFDGSLFEKLYEHSKTEKRCRIFGPDVIIHAKEVDHIPKRGEPLMSLTMYRQIVCSSSYSKAEKEEFGDKVVKMGGQFSKNLLKETSVLIAKDVVSKKSQIARKHKIPIVSRSWIDKCWSLVHCQKFFLANDKINDHKIPIFAGVKISVSQVSSSTRTKLEKGSRKYGYIYQPHLSEDVTHLICLRDEGAKYDFSREHNIYTVFYEWVTKSVVAGYALPEVQFMVGGPLDKDDDDPLRLKVQKQTTSIVSVMEDSQNEREPETIKHSSMSSSHDWNCNRTQTVPKTKHYNGQAQKGETFVDCLRRCLQLETASLFDNFEINLYGFKSEPLNLAKQLIAREFGFCSMKISETTTVVVVSSDCSAKENVRQILTESELYCPVVSERWLTDSVEKSKLEPYDPYLVFTLESETNQEHRADEEVQEVQPSLGFVVTKKGRSIEASCGSKKVSSHETLRKESQGADVFEGTLGKIAALVHDSGESSQESSQEEEEEEQEEEMDDEEEETKDEDGEEEEEKDDEDEAKEEEDEAMDQEEENGMDEEFSEEMPMMKVPTSTSYSTQKKRSWEVPTFGPQGSKDVAGTQSVPLAEPEVEPSLQQRLAKFTGHIISRDEIKEIKANTKRADELARAMKPKRKAPNRRPIV